MRKVLQFALAGAWLVGCGGNGGGKSPDAQGGNHPPPRVIPGGGIGDGAIDGVVNLYVIDDATRTPVANATVRVGTLDGTTDTTGLFVASGVVGPQAVIVKATSYRAEMWIGANGANMTVDLKPAVDPAPTSANLSGAITGFGAITVPSGHNKTAVISYSQDDKLSDAENNIPTTGLTNICDVGTVAAPCNFTITTRTGKLGLVAVIYDHDTKGTITPADDTFTFLGWAARTGITVASGVAQTGMDLAMVDVGNLNNVTVAFGSPPPLLPNVAGLVGLELGGGDGVLQLPVVLSATSSTVLAPTLGAFAGAMYRFSAFANDGSTAAATQSGVLSRHQTATSLAAGTWLVPPTNVALTRAGGVWSAVAGALVQGATFDQGTTTVTHLLNVTVFDASTTFTIPDLVALPATGTIDAKATALGGTLDVTNFAIDTDLDKVNQFASEPVPAIN